MLATNPSNRNLTIQVRDVVRADGSQIDATTGERRLLPAGAVDYPVLTHSGTALAGTQTVSDTATATYIDTVTGQTIPQDTTASATAPVVNNPPGNATAQITDVTTSSGRPISVDSLLSQTNPGTVNVPIGQPVTTPITWKSGTVNGSGRATLGFTVYLGDEFDGQVDVTDTATLVDANGDTASRGRDSRNTRKSSRPHDHLRQDGRRAPDRGCGLPLRPLVQGARSNSG